MDEKQRIDALRKIYLDDPFTSNGINTIVKKHPSGVISHVWNKFFADRQFH
jgi:hypothetical protein